MPTTPTPSAVWILDDGLIMGGGQRFGLRLAEAFAVREIPVRFLAPAASAFGQEASRLGFEVVDVTYPRLVPPAVNAMPGTVARLRELLESAPAGTLVIGNTARCQAYATAAVVMLRRSPVLVHLLHEQVSAERLSARTVYRRIGVPIAVGDQTAAVYRNSLSGVTIRGVNNFMEDAHVERVIGERRPAPGGPRPIVGVLARMVAEKGVLDVVEELAAVADTWESVRIAAPPQDAAYAERVAARIGELGLQDRIELLGEVADIDPFFAGIDVLVVPSTRREGPPTVILESLLYDRPVIARELLRTPSLDDLPIGYYDTPADLGARLADLPTGSVDADTFLRRFGAREVVDALLQVAAEHADGGPHGYFDWHDEPGYFRDIVRHFSPSDRLLDVGCGTAWLQNHFADYCGIDSSAEAVGHAQALGRNVQLHDVEEPFPFPDASFDAVIVKDLLEHVLDPVGVVREIFRVLRPGGAVFASSPDAQRWVWDDYTHRRPYTLTGYRRLFRDQGFIIDDGGFESVMPGIGVVSGMTRNRRRPKPLAVLARTRLVRRNVWVLARRV